MSGAELKSHDTYKKNLIFIYSVVGHNQSTNSIVLDTFGKHFFGKPFIGVFPKDKTPKLKMNQMAILNLDNSDEAGSHWVAICRDPKGTLFYDSFGRHFNTVGFDKKNWTNADLKDREQLSKILNDTIEQADCGQRCLAFMKTYKQLGYEMAKKI